MKLLLVSYKYLKVKCINQIDSILNIFLRMMIFTIILIITNCEGNSGGDDKIIQPDPIEEDAQDDTPPN